MSDEYRDLLLDIAEEVKPKELAVMKFLCADILADDKPDVKTEEELLVEVFNFFRELEKRNVLSVSNLDKLKHLLGKAKRDDLVMKVENFQSRCGREETSPAPSSSSSKARHEVVHQQTTQMKSNDQEDSEDVFLGKDIENKTKNLQMTGKNVFGESQLYSKNEEVKQMVIGNYNNIISSTQSSTCHLVTSAIESNSSIHVPSDLQVEKQDEGIREEAPKQMENEDKGLSANKREELVQKHEETANKSEKVREDHVKAKEKKEMIKDGLPIPMQKKEIPDNSFQKSEERENVNVDPAAAAAAADDMTREVKTEVEEKKATMTGSGESLNTEITDNTQQKGKAKNKKRRKTRWKERRKAEKQPVSEDVSLRKDLEKKTSNMQMTEEDMAASIKSNSSIHVPSDLQVEKQDEGIREDAPKQMENEDKGLPANKREELVPKQEETANISEKVREDHLKAKEKKEMIKDGLPIPMEKEEIPDNSFQKSEERENVNVDPAAAAAAADDMTREVQTEVEEKKASMTGSGESLKTEITGSNSFQQICVLSLCTKWQSWGESIPTINRELCLALARAGNRVSCLVLASSDFDKEDARKGNVELIQCSDKPGINNDDPQLLYHDQKITFLPDLVIGHGKLTGPASVFHAENRSCHRLHVIHDLPSECLTFDCVIEQQCNEEQLAKNADFVAVVGSLLKEKWSTLINRNVIEIIPGLPELTTRNRIPSPHCRCFVPAKFSAPFASGLELAIKSVTSSSKRETRSRRTTLIACNTDPSGSVKPAKRILKKIDKSSVDLNERININKQEAHFAIQGATVYLSPARVEAFGVAALDAIAIGIPIVISAHSGLAHTILQYFDKKFHPCINDIFVDPKGANDEDEESKDADIWAISLDRISLFRDEAFNLANELRSEWKAKFSWDAAVQNLMLSIFESGKLPFRLPQSNSTFARGIPESCLKLVKGLNLFEKRQKFVLFLSPEDPMVLNNVVHLGLVHWAAVFDFDQESTTKGYLKRCESFLENTGKPACRMLPPPIEDIGKENPKFNLPNGIPWILLRGVPDMERDIDRNLDWIQEIFHHLRKRHSTNITLLIMWNSENNKHLCKKLYQIQLQVQASPHWKNAVQLVLLSTSDQVDSRLDDIAEEWGVKIRKVDINQFCNALYCTAATNPLYQLDPDFSLPKRHPNGVQGDVTSETLPANMRWVDSVMEVLYTSIGSTPEFGKDDAQYFYRGGKISWYGIEMNYAVERESWKPLRKVIEEEMKYPGAAFLTLFHQRGTGGTTSSRKLLYDFHLRYPCVCLKTINYETFLAIKVIWEFCSLPVIILADINEAPGVEDNDIEALYGNLSNEKVSCLVLHTVHRHYQAEPKKEKESSQKETVILAKALTDKERKDFIKIYSLQSPTKKSELGKMKHADEQLQIPFYYGLVAFGEEFKGLEPFVSDCLRGLDENQRRALCFLSMAHQYTTLDLDFSAFAGIFNLKPRQLHSIEDIFTPESVELLIEEYGRWRPRHYTIGKEIMRQLLTVPYDIHIDNWQRNLADKAMDFISYMEEETTNAFLLNRISDEKTYKRFSSLVEDIPEDEDVVKVFEKAIAVHPHNPFFKAHLGRYYSVHRGLEGFDLALKYTDDSILLASGMSKNTRSQLTQMRGMIFKRQVKNQIEKLANLDEIISLAKEGVAAFTRAASISVDRLENCYIPQVRMMCVVFRYIDNFFGGIFKYLHSSAADPFILDGISESSDILESVSGSISYPELRRDLFSIGAFGRHKKSGDKKVLINHFKELKKTSKVSTASINREIVLLQLELCKENKKPVSDIAEELKELLEEALKYDKKIDLTMRLWVRVAPYIPVELQAAETKIAAWCNQGKSALSYLYRYIFTCIRILEGGRDQRFEDDRKIARNELFKIVNATKRLTLFHPDHPVVFLGTTKGMGQLVTVEESVTNVRKQRLIPEGFAKRLRRLKGIITKTSKVGQIKAEGLTVSFRTDLCQPPLIGESYLAKKVSFYLAFTYFETDGYNVKIMAE